MAVSMTLKHLRKLSSGRWLYRRRVSPAELVPFAGKREFKEVFDARNDADVAREHTRLEAKFAREMREAEAKRRRSTGTVSGSASPRQVAEEARRYAADLLAGVHGLDEDDAHEVMAEAIAARYPTDPEEGLPVGLSAFDALTVRALRMPDEPPPAPTLEDARAIYVKERLRGGTPAEDVKAVQRVDRMMREAKAALGRFPALVELTREDARKVRDHMLGLTKRGGEGLSPASVKRNLTTLKAMVNFAATELGLPGTFVNPFNKLDVAGMEARFSEGELRNPLPPAVLRAVRERVTAGGNPELALIWRLLQGTGCRLAEVTGLRVEDVAVSGLHPHVRVAWHEDRRVKTKASIRHVPLVGDALEAAKEALELPREGPALFPRYGGKAGPGNASAALMKHVRRVTSDERHVVHSLRHNMADWLNGAEAPPLTKNLILGHQLGGLGERVYGGTEEKLRATTKAMKGALAVAAERLREV